MKDTSIVISNYLQENLARNTQPVTQHEYLTKMANSIIDEYLGVAVEYINPIKTQMIDQFG